MPAGQTSCGAPAGPAAPAASAPAALTPQQEAVQILQSDGYTATPANVTNDGAMPADVTGFALSTTDATAVPDTAAAQDVENVTVFDNTADAQAAYAALNADIVSYGERFDGDVPTTSLNGNAVVLDGSQGDVAEVDFDTSAWMAATP